MENITLYEAMQYIDNYLVEATISKKKQNILDNQDDIKKNFNKISKDLKNLVLSSLTKKYNNGQYKFSIAEEKFFKDHEDHKEQHYLLKYTITSNDLSKSDISKLLANIGNNVEKEFKGSYKSFLDKGLYFDNKKEGDSTRFVELHYDFY